MRSPRHVGRFLLGVVILYGLLIAPWPGVATWYAIGFRNVGNAVFGRFGDRGLVRFRPIGPDERLRRGTQDWDTEFMLEIRGQPGATGVWYNSWQAGYIPTALLASLVLCTPVPWKRRWWAFGWGMLLVNCFVLIRVGALILWKFRATDYPGLYAVSPGMEETLARLSNLVSLSPVTSCVVPVLLWMLLTPRRADWAAVFGMEEHRLPRTNKAD